MNRLAILVLFGFVAACGGEGRISPITNPDGTPPDGTGGIGGPINTRTLTLQGPSLIELRPRDVRDIAVQLRVNNVPVQGDTIDFRLEGAAAGAGLTARSAITDANGVAVIRLTASEQPAEFQLIASAAATEDAVATIKVTRDPRGSITVYLSYTEAHEQALGTAEVRLFEGSHTCATLLGQSILPAASSKRDLVTIADTASFTGYEEGTVLTVMAFGRVGATEAAVGCVDSKTIVAGQDLKVIVPLKLKGYDISGVYEMTTTYDFHRAIPGTVGDVMRLTTDLFDDGDDPARYIVEMLQKALFGFGPFEQAAIDLVDEILHNLLPAQAWAIFRAFGDLGDTVFNLEVSSTVSVNKNGVNKFRATEVWDRITYVWTGNCDPKHFPGCNRHELLLRNTPLEVITQFELETPGRPEVAMRPHELRFNYGMLFQLFLQEVALPRLTGVRTTEELFKKVLNCQGIAQNLDCRDGTCNGSFQVSGINIVSVTALADACYTALGSLGKSVDNAIAGLGGAGQTTITRAGAIDAVDEDGDLIPESWEGGVINGKVRLGGSEQPYVAIFNAARIDL